MTGTVRVLRIDVDGTASLHQIGDGNLRAWQDLVGGYIEGIYGPAWCGYVNESGLLDGLPVNPFASVLVRDAGGIGYGVLVGPVVFFGRPNDDGDPTDCPDWLLDLAIAVGAHPIEAAP
ncbi:MAG TPA: DUF3846 domain-containing protein [Jatrophihabitantaceae bacterium]